VQSRPIIPMMTVPLRRTEKSAPMPAMSQGGENNDKVPEGPVSCLPTHFATNSNVL
jgi:hypothetical protein